MFINIIEIRQNDRLSGECGPVKSSSHVWEGKCVLLILLMERSYFLSLDAEQFVNVDFFFQIHCPSGATFFRTQTRCFAGHWRNDKDIFLCGVRWSHSHNVMALLKLNES